MEFLGRHVSYDTHETHLLSDEHIAALRRCENFHDRLVELERALNAVTDEERKLSSGWILPGSISLGSVHPEACERRERMTVEARIRAYGQEQSIELEPQGFESAEAILEKLKARGEACVPILRERKEKGDF